MIEKKPNIFNFIKKEEYTGSMDGMRYMLRKLEEGDEKHLECIIWPGPLSYSKTPESLKQRIRFPFSEDGVVEAFDRLNEELKA
jgi:hypothetical protein